MSDCILFDVVFNDLETIQKRILTCVTCKTGKVWALRMHSLFNEHMLNNKRILIHK